MIVNHKVKTSPSVQHWQVSGTEHKVTVCHHLGSPYTLEIVDSSAVSASGEGLSSVEVNRRATFMVNTGHVGSSGDVKVNVTCEYDFN